jgi:hypothetical protein
MTIGLGADCEDEWIAWTGTEAGHGLCQGRPEPGAEPGWWLVYGELPPGAAARPRSPTAANPR